MEEVQRRDSAYSHAYEVTREYKIFDADDQKPTSEFTAKIDFTPPNLKIYKITQATGNKIAIKIVRDVLEQETAAAKRGSGNEISRTNYDFVFLRRENFGVVPECVLRIVPKRKKKFLILGQIWVDKKTFRVRRIEGVPAKSPSTWIKNLHVTLQFAALNGMWIPVSLDAIATYDS